MNVREIVSRGLFFFSLIKISWLFIIFFLIAKLYNCGYVKSSNASEFWWTRVERDLRVCGQKNLFNVTNYINVTTRSFRVNKIVLFCCSLYLP